MKKLLELINNIYDEQSIKKFNDIFNNLKIAKEIANNKTNFNETFKKGIESAKLLCQIKIDIDTILASVCLNVVKKGFVSPEELELDRNIIKLITDTKEFENLHYEEKEEDITNLRAMFVSMSKDIRVLIIKLADITVTAKNPINLTKAELEHLHKEIKEIYAPLAARLGLSFIKSELQDENFKYLEPNIYKDLESKISVGQLSREIGLNKIIKRLKKMLKDLKIQGQVYGRIKHLSSIYSKLNGRAGGNLSNIHDLTAVRVIVKDVNDCYTILGHVHTLYTPIENTFRDYIAKPKLNGYQSLHTTVYIENQEIVEVQIRTQEMHDFAEYGIAAHWLYKEHKTKISSLDKKLTWIRQIIENADSLSAREMIGELKTNDYEGEIYVQTPKGNIIELPVGSTPIDFAYNVHSEVGNKCIGAKVNGKMVPLATILNNGEIVEIITSTMSKGPSRDWLKIVKSVSARSKINDFFRKERKDENIKRGKVILDQAAKNKNIPLHKYLEESYVSELFERYSFADLDDMYASVGHGGISATQILTKLVKLDEEYKAKNNPVTTVKIQNLISNDQLLQKHDVIVIKGLNNLLTRLAKCCTPIPGDDVVGYISRGKGVTIHRTNCKMLHQLENERLIKAEWGNIENATYQAEINIIAKNSSGVLAAITTKISELKINISGISSSPLSSERSLINLLVNIKEKQELTDLINKLKTLSSIYDVYRNSEK